MKPTPHGLPHPGWIKIVKAVRSTGMRQVDIAGHTGMSQNFISNLLRGKRFSPRFDRGLKLYLLYLERVLKKRLVAVTLL
jgi:transcriptional regulator with XRE-family HTH domain